MSEPVHTHAWVAIPLIVGAAAARLIHGILTARELAGVTPLRLAAAGGTYLFGVAPAVAAALSLL